MPSADTWGMQHRRARRSLAALEIAQHVPGSEQFDDAAHRFFQDGWNLKDWIKNDQTVPTSIRSEVEGKVLAHECMRIAGDLANGSKHLILNKNHTGATVDRHMTLQLGGGPLVNHDWVVELPSGRTVGVIDLARQVDQTWNSLLTGWALSSSSST
jgi:hypothetical protein